MLTEFEWLVIAAFGAAAMALAGHATAAVVSIRHYFNKSAAWVDRRITEAEAKVAAVEKRVTDLKLPEIPAMPHVPTTAEIIAALPPAPEVPSQEEIADTVTAALAAYFRSDDSGKLADGIAAKVKGAMDGSISGQFGNLHKVGIQQMEGALDKIDFGDKWKNIAWQNFVGGDAKHAIAKTLVRAIAQQAGGITISESPETSSEWADWAARQT